MKEKLVVKWEELNNQLLNFIRKRIDNPEDAEDLLQEVYIKVHENIDRLRDEERMVSWIYQITRNTVKRCYSRCYRVKSVEFEDTYEEFIAKEEENFNQEIGGNLKEFIEELPETYREVIRLHDYEGLTHKEIGERLGISANTSKSRFKRGKDKLKVLLDECCTFQIDKFGNIVDYKKNSSN